MLEFDPINNFHLHANLYHVYRSGTSTIPDEYTDMITMSQGERSILEFTYKYTGKYMFHAHKTEFAEKGWMSLFLVTDSKDNYNDDRFNTNYAAINNNNNQNMMINPNQSINSTNGVN